MAVAILDDTTGLIVVRHARTFVAAVRADLAVAVRAGVFHCVWRAGGDGRHESLPEYRDVQQAVQPPGSM
ncbi:hypothetical protein BN2476_2140002 [Paraburkholderia piptadeniae]|uniref:Uncharacterized protein n=1 Tax=Paraburkholderia piptadeniae TaxID=1701573 RepID=A0A1N7SXJ6_9BURK|nr:hypothetical protein BN2476_2140002 [Paraburkholderia piptadeniae]